MKLNKWGKVNLILIGVIGVILLVIYGQIRKEKLEMYPVELLLTASATESTLVNYSPPPVWLVGAINKGDKEMSSSGEATAEVIGKDSYEEGVNKVTVIMVNLPMKKDKIGNYRYKQKTVNLGGLVSLVINNAKVNGIVIGIGENLTTFKYKRIKTRMYERRDWFVEKIKVGDKMYSENNQLAAEVISKKIIGTYKLKDGIGMLADIEVGLRVKAIEIDGVSYFAYVQPLKVGNLLYIPMQEYNLYDVELAEVSDD